jgi:hypothetical protein
MFTPTREQDMNRNQIRAATDMKLICESDRLIRITTKESLATRNLINAELERRAIAEGLTV